MASSSRFVASPRASATRVPMRATLVLDRTCCGSLRLASPFHSCSAAGPCDDGRRSFRKLELTMATRRALVFACFLATAASASGFAVGVFHARRASAMPAGKATGTAGQTEPARPVSRDALVAEVKKQIAAEMGLLPVNVLRERRASFVELYSYDKAGKTHYGTAGYLGNGYFITVKHAVVALNGEDGPASPIQAVKVVYKGEEIATRVVDTGDAKSEVDRGDW